jgi:nitrogen fixation protein FixH
MKNGLSIILLIFVIGISGCGSHKIQPSPLNVMQASNKYHVGLKMNPTPAKTLKKNQLYINLTDNNNNKVSHADVTVSLSMKNMNHGDLKVSAALTKKGGYLAEVIPVMNGKWMAEVTAHIHNDTVKTIYEFESKR